MLQQEAGAAGKSPVAPHGEEARPPVGTVRAPGGRRRRCCAPLSGVQRRREHSVLSRVFQDRKSHLESDKKKSFQQERSDSIRVGLHGCLYVSSLKEIARTAPLLRV